MSLVEFIFRKAEKDLNFTKDRLHLYVLYIVNLPPSAHLNLLFCFQI